MKPLQIIQRVTELLFFTTTAIGFIVIPVAFYVLGIIYNLKQDLEIWWVMGLPLLVFTAIGIDMMRLSVKGVKSLWKEIKKK